MSEKEKQKLINEIQILQQQIDDIKIEDTPNYKKLRELVNERDRIEFRLDMYE